MRLSLRTAGSGLLLLAAQAAFADEERRVLASEEMTEEERQKKQLEAMAEQKRLESISRLKAILAQGVEGERKAEMLLRLSELYYQHGKAIYFREMEAFNAEFDDCFNTEGCDTDSLEEDHKGSAAWYGKSVKLYENILRNYPRYARADEATYYLGMAQLELGNKPEALKAFKKLVKLFAQSQYLPDGYIQIGEYYFDKGDAFPALKAFLKASTFKDSDRYPYALYKLGWCYYNVGEYGKAIDSMKAVVAFSMENQDSKLNLEGEALKDLVRFFADGGEMDEAYAYFSKLGRKDLIQSTLRTLASMYYEQGKFEQSIQTYRRLILEDPKAPSNPINQEKIILAYRQMAQDDQVLAEIQRLRTDYGPESAWARANAADPDVVNDANNTIETAMRTMAIGYHEQARKYAKSRHPRTSEVRETARQAYAAYLTDYGSHKQAYEVRYAYGELLYKLERYDEAFDQYMAVVDMDPSGARSQFCAESAIFSADMMVKREGGGGQLAKPKAGQKVEAKDLTAWEQRLVDSCNKYATLYPNDKKVRNIIYKSAYLLYNKGHLSEAGDQFRAVISMDPGSKEAEQAAHLILDAFVLNQDYTDLKKNAKFFYDQEGLGSSKFKKEVYEIYQNASFKVIEIDFAANGDKNKTADDFVAFYDEFPQSPNAALALNNAAAYYYQVDRVADSMRVRHILIDDEKFGEKTRFYYNQVGFLANDYERLADFEKAVFYYQKLNEILPEEIEKIEKAKKKEKDEEKKTKMDEQMANMRAMAADAIYSAAVFQNALGHWQEGIADYRTFLKDYGSDERALNVHLIIANILEQNGQNKEAAAAFKDFYSTQKEAKPSELYFARLHYGQNLEAMGDSKKAIDAYRAAVKAYEKDVAGGLEPGAHTEYAADMMFQLAELEFAAFDALEIKGVGKSGGRRGEDKALKRGLEKKTAAMKALEKSLTAIVETGSGEWGLASLVLMGQVFEDMGTSLVDSSVPFYLTEDQAEFYRMGLEDKQYALEERAVGTYKLALDKAYELHLYTESTGFAARRLGEMRPDDFPGLYETIPQPKFVAEDVRTFDAETSLD